MPKPRKTTSKRVQETTSPVQPPRFASEAEERNYWQETDTAGHVDWSDAHRVRFPNLKPSTATISLRLPEGMLDELKILANQRDVPYQSLLKIFLAERLEVERERRRRAG